MYQRESSIYERNIRYNIVDSPRPRYEPSRYFFGDSDYSNSTVNSEIHDNSNSSNNHNETIVLAFHSSLICFKIALCVLL